MKICFTVSFPHQQLTFITSMAAGDRVVSWFYYREYDWTLTVAFCRFLGHIAINIVLRLSVCYTAACWKAVDRLAVLAHMFVKASLCRFDSKTSDVDVTGCRKAHSRNCLKSFMAFTCVCADLLYNPDFVSSRPFVRWQFLSENSPVPYVNVSLKNVQHKTAPKGKFKF